MADHARDVIGLLDSLAIERPVLVGHSFGGMLALYLASRSPERFPRLVVVDAAAALATPAVRDALAPMLARLGAVAPSWDAYLDAVKRLPYLQDSWSPAIERYFREYVDTAGDGSVRQRVHPAAVHAAIEGILAEDWHAIASSVGQPVLLINAKDPYGPPGAPPFLPQAQALATVGLLTAGTYLAVSGNHVTMLFGDHAREFAPAIRDFASSGATSRSSTPQSE
jgi:pimeloyl-ACP methyl ester carboxylesterase